MRKVLFFLILWTAAPAVAFDFGTMDPNRWYRVTPAYNFGLHGGPGARYENRHWCNLRYNGDRKTLVFFGGFSSPAGGSPASTPTLSMNISRGPTKCASNP
jgi:hypothetical protein